MSRQKCCYCAEGASQAFRVGWPQMCGTCFALLAPADVRAAARLLDNAHIRRRYATDASFRERVLARQRIWHARRNAEWNAASEEEQEQALKERTDEILAELWTGQDFPETEVIESLPASEKRMHPPPSAPRLPRKEEERRIAAWRASRTDAEAAASLGLARETFMGWRLRRGLPLSRYHDMVSFSAAPPAIGADSALW